LIVKRASEDGDRKSGDVTIDNAGGFLNIDGHFVWVDTGWL
jgi:hypothetical protein